MWLQTGKQTAHTTVGFTWFAFFYYCDLSEIINHHYPLNAFIGRDFMRLSKEHDPGEIITRKNNCGFKTPEMQGTGVS